MLRPGSGYAVYMLLLLAACTQAPDSDSEPGDTQSAGLLPAVPVWNAQDVELAAQSVMAAPMPRLDHLEQDYLELMTQGTEACPGLGNNIKDNAVYGCETGTGMYFSGVSQYFDEDREGVQYRSLAGDFLVTDTLGRTMDWGAGWEVYFMEGGSQFRWLGSVIWPGREATTERISVTLSGHQDQDAFEVSGGMNLAAGTVELSLYRDDACPLGRGTLSMRGPDKRWYRTELDCSGCGPLDFEGQDLGQACLDPTALMDALEGPLMDPDWSGR